MAEKKSSADFIAKIVKDPNNPPDTVMLTGYLGASSEDGHTRLYFDPNLASYVEIPNDAILHTEPAETGGLGASHVWIKRDAVLIYGSAGSQRPKGTFLEGPIMQAHLAGGAAAPPAQTLLPLCPIITQHNCPPSAHAPCLTPHQPCHSGPALCTPVCTPICPPTPHQPCPTPHHPCPTGPTLCCTIPVACHPSAPPLCQATFQPACQQTPHAPCLSQIQVCTPACPPSPLCTVQVNCQPSLGLPCPITPQCPVLTAPPQCPILSAPVACPTVGPCQVQTIACQPEGGPVVAQGVAAAAPAAARVAVSAACASWLCATQPALCPPTPLDQCPTWPCNVTVQWLCLQQGRGAAAPAAPAAATLGPCVSPPPNCGIVPPSLVAPCLTQQPHCVSVFIHCQTYPTPCPTHAFPCPTHGFPCPSAFAPACPTHQQPQCTWICPPVTPFCGAAG